MDSVHDKILNELTGLKKSLNIQEISERCGLNPHSTARHLDTLEILGLVRKIEIGTSKKYYLVNSIPVSGLIDVASDLILIVNSRHRIEYLNNSAQKKLGLEGRQISGERLESLNLDIFSSPQVLEGLKTFTPEKIIRIEIPYERSDEHLWYSVSIMNLYLKPGSISIAIIAEDITGLKIDQRCQELMISVLQILNFRGKKGEDIINQILQVIIKSALIEAVGIMVHGRYDYPSYKSIGLSEAFFLDLKNQYSNITSNLLIQYGDKAVTPDEINERLLSEIEVPYDFFTNNGSFYTNSISNLLKGFSDTDERDTPLNRCMREGYESSAFIPLHTQDGIIGTLQLLDQRKNVFSQKIIEFFEGLSNSIGIALEHQQMEKKVRDSENKYRMIADNVSDVITTMDLQGHYTYISPSVFHLRGYTPEEVMSQTIFDMVDPDLYPQVMSTIQKGIKKVKKTGKTVILRGEIKQKHRDGSWVWTEIISHFVCDESGNPVKIIGVSRNISERKKIQEELEQYQSDLESLVKERTRSLYHEITIRQQIETLLRESEQRLEDIIDFAPDATLATDLNGTIIVWNHAIEEMTGFAAADMIGKNKEICLSPIYGQGHVLLMDLIFSETEKILQHYDHINREGVVITAESSSVFLKGEQKTIWIKAAPLYDADSNVTGTIESLRDITYFRNIEREIEKLKDLLTLLMNSFSTLVVVIAANGKTLMMNKVLLDLLEYSSDEVMGTDFLNAFVFSKDRKRLNRTFRHIFSDGKERHNKYRVVSKSGTLYLIEWDKKLVKTTEGEPEFLFATGVYYDDTYGEQQ